MSDVLVRIEHVHKTYHQGEVEVPVLRDVDFALHAGESISIVGESGVGKSTLLHILGALDKPSQGHVYYQDQDIHQQNDEASSSFRNQHIGFIFQFHHLLPEFNALENTALPGLIRGWSEKKAFAVARQRLDEVGLADRLQHVPAELSGGERQRIAIARALMLKPSIILADEPTGNLDIHTASQAQDILFNLCREHGSSLVVVTHNAQFANLAQRRMRMVNGGIEEVVS